MKIMHTSPKFRTFSLLFAVVATLPAAHADSNASQRQNERDRRAREVNQLLDRLYDAEQAPGLRVLGSVDHDATATQIASAEHPAAPAATHASHETGVQPRLVVQRPVPADSHASSTSWLDNASTGSRILNAVLMEIQGRNTPRFDLEHFSSPVPQLSPVSQLEAAGLGPHPSGPADQPLVPVSLLEAASGQPQVSSQTVADPNPAQQTPSARSSALTDHGVRVNRASVGDLVHGLRVDAVRAANIVEFREIYGKFSRPEDLAQVAGITNTMTMVWAQADLLSFD